MRIKNARNFPVATTLGHKPSGESFLTVVIKGTFQLASREGRARETREQWPIFLADELYQDSLPPGLLKFENDLAPFKPRTDIVLVGHAYPSGGARTACDVEIAVGPTDFVLRVVGDRQWSCAEAGALATQVGPLPFSRMPLTIDRAFGGRDVHAGVESPLNPWGRGLIAARAARSIHGRELPNLEDPDEMIQSWEARPRPFSCGFIPRVSAIRSRYLGTYDEAWRRDVAPCPPADFDFAFHNAAHPYLQVQPHLVGNEAVTLKQVTPGGGRVDLHLPCLRPLVSVKHRIDEPPEAQRVSYAQRADATVARLDTLVFVPDESLFYAVWRATLAVGAEETLAQVAEIEIEYEGMTPARRVSR